MRVERGADHIRQTPPNLLQVKGDHPFFDQTAKLPKGEVYVSEFELNQEFGKLVVPYLPVIRTATPVFDEAGILRGEVIINVDAVYWFNLLRETLARDETLLVTNQAGDYLAHPNTSKTFGFDIGNRYRIQDDISASTLCSMAVRRNSQDWSGRQAAMNSSPRNGSTSTPGNRIAMSS